MGKATNEVLLADQAATLIGREEVAEGTMPGRALWWRPCARRLWVPESKRKTFEQMSSLATEISSQCLSKMRMIAMSSKRIQNRQILLCPKRQVSVELLLFCSHRGWASAPSRPTQGQASGVRRFHTGGRRVRTRWSHDGLSHEDKTPSVSLHDLSPYGVRRLPGNGIRSLGGFHREL